MFIFQLVWSSNSRKQEQPNITDDKSKNFGKISEPLLSLNGDIEDGFSVRAIYRKNYKNLGRNAELIKEACEELEDLNWLCQIIRRLQSSTQQAQLILLTRPYVLDTSKPLL